MLKVLCVAFAFPFGLISSFLACVRVSRSLNAATVNGPQQVSQAGKVVRAFDRAKKAQNVVGTDLFMLVGLVWCDLTLSTPLKQQHNTY